MAFWGMPVCIKESTDYDIISWEKESLVGIPFVEWHDINILNNKEIMERYSGPSIIIEGIPVNVCTPEGLSIIKRSHLHRDLSFGKHITHYHKYLRPYSMNWTEEDRALLARRIEMTEKEYPQRYPKLNVTVEEFFDDAVVKVYNHDYLHELVAYNDAPMYTKMQKDKSKAWCERELWEQFTELEKQQCVAEESYVIAIERWLVPRKWNFPAKLAYMKALEKVSTTLTSGWFRAYALDFYTEILQLFNQDKIDKVRRVLNEFQK